MNTRMYALGLICLAIGVSGCVANSNVKDYSAFRADGPRSILVVPPLNNTTSVMSPNYFYSTVSRPFAERGYYVYPAHMIKRLLEQEGLADAGLVHSADPTRLGLLFGCGAVLYIAIDRWETQYLVLMASTNVQFTYILRSCGTGATLWEHTETRTYTPQSLTSSGSLLADLVIMAVGAVAQRAVPNYIPLAQAANASAANVPGLGLPAGPYLPDFYNNDLIEFPSGASLD